MERFWSKVEKTDGCWNWRGARLRRPHDGSLSYGVFNLDGRSQPAHRVAWQLLNGPIPEGKWLLHDCDNQGCVRPDHLYVGTHADNTRDAVMRRRMESGEDRWNHRLRPVDVVAIRAMAAAGIATETIGPLFGVSGRTARNVVARKAWQSVP